MFASQIFFSFFASYINHTEHPQKLNGSTGIFSNHIIEPYFVLPKNFNRDTYLNYEVNLVVTEII